MVRLPENILHNTLNNILNQFLTEMMNAFRSTRNAWIELEKEKKRMKTLQEKAESASLAELINYQQNIVRKEDLKPPITNPFIPPKILETDKSTLSFQETIEKVEVFIANAKSQGYNKFLIAGDYSVSLRGIDTNSPPKQITLKMPQREYIYWNCYNSLKKIQKRIDYLAKMTLVFQFSFFETCLKGLIKKIYEKKPDFMRTGNLDKEVDWYGRNGIDKIAKRLKSRFGIDLTSNFPKWEKFREAYFFRNIIVHNSGIIDRILCEQLDYDLSQIGENLDINTEYIENIYSIIRECLIFIRNGLHLLE